MTACQRRPGFLGQRAVGAGHAGPHWRYWRWFRLLTLTCAVPALTASAVAATPPTPTLAALTAQAAAVQAELSAGAKTLDAAPSEARHPAVGRCLSDRAGGSTECAARQPAGPARGIRGAALRGSDRAGVDGGPRAGLRPRRDRAGRADAVDHEPRRAEVLHAAVYDEEQAEQLDAQARKLSPRRLSCKPKWRRRSPHCNSSRPRRRPQLTAAQTAYQTSLEKAALAKIAAATAAHNSAARAAAVKQANALAADTAGAPGGAALCDAQSAGPYPSGPWGGYADGFIPSSQLCSITGGGRLRPDAAVAFDKMSQAYARVFGSNMCVTDSYRSYTEQVKGVSPTAVIGGGSGHK